MGRDIRYDAKDDIVVARTAGQYILEQEIDTVQKVLAQMQRHDCSRCLFDHRNADVVARTLEAYDRPKVYEQLGIGHGVKMAIVSREKQHELKFYETVCVNRGWNVRVFRDYDQAVAWLGGKDAPGT